MATEKPSSTNASTQTPDDLSALARRLRSYTDGIKIGGR
jgi:hypothetical protein